MKTLIVEDDFTSRRLLTGLLFPYGRCDIAVDGQEAVEAFRMAWEENEPYDLICLDIMMPAMDGQEVLKEVRSLEMEKGIGGLDGVKIIMTTVLGDSENILEAFKEQCDAYLVKPIEQTRVIRELESLGLAEPKETQG